MSVLETKLGEPWLDQIMRNKFGSLMQINNFLTHQTGQILVLWNSVKLNLEVLETTHKSSIVP